MKNGAGKRQLITERTVREAARAGRAIELSDAPIITPAARDLATQLGVSLRSVPSPSVRRPAATPPFADRERPKAHTAPSEGADGESKRTVVLGADHGGFRLKEALKPLLAELGFTVSDVGCSSTDPVDYPVFAARVAEAVAAGEAVFGIMVDGAGIGSAMVANKIKGVRAALCYDLTTAKNAREHNNANVLTLGGGLIGERLGLDIARTFLTAPFGGDRHLRRVAMIDALDRLADG